MAKILVIDDNAALRRMMQRALANANHTVLEAQDGQEGLTRFKEHGADIVITDLIMPEKEGIETMRELIKDSPETKIVAMSGGGASHNMMFLDVARAVGAAATLAKPFRPADLIDLVERLLSGDQSPQAEAC